MGIVLLLIGLVVFYFFYIKPKIINPFRDGLHGNNRTSKRRFYKYDSNNKDANKEKGDIFEKFIVQKFDKNFFTILEWRSDKYIDGQYAISNKLPDLEFQFITKGYQSRFAIECKYRKRYMNNQIEIARDYQINNYRKFETERKIPVYIVLGLGGKPSKPDELFLIPIKYINSNIIYYKDIIPYKRNVDTQFYFDRYDELLK